MSKAWKRSDGKVIKGDDGKILICDDCPCVAGCASWPTSLFVTQSSFSGTITTSDHATVIAAKPNFVGFYSSFSVGYCWWFGESSTPGVHFVLKCSDTFPASGSGFFVEILGNFAPPFGSAGWSSGGPVPYGLYDGGEFVIT